MRNQPGPPSHPAMGRSFLFSCGGSPSPIEKACGAGGDKRFWRSFGGRVAGSFRCDEALAGLRTPGHRLTAPKDLRAEDQSLQLFEPDRGEIREGFRARRNCQGTGAAEGIRADVAPATSPA